MDAPSFERALFGKELEEYQRRVAEAQEKEAKVTPKERERIEKANKESRGEILEGARCREC